MIKRFDQLDIATSDLADAIAIYAKNFGFAVRGTTAAGEATIGLGDAQMRLQSGPAVAELIGANGEGLAAIWLEADDVVEMAERLKAAGAGTAPIRIEGGKRILAVDAPAANQVALYIFDRKGA